MKTTPKFLMLAGLIVFAVLLIVAVVLGYSGSSDLAAVGNLVLLVGVALGGLIFLGGVLAWIVKMGVQSARE